MSHYQQTNSERIVQLVYRRLKGLALTIQEDQELQTWLDRSDSNRRIVESLSDEEWLKKARKRYYAPGKEDGLRQLRQQLFNEPIRRYRKWWQKLWDFAVPVFKNE